MNAEELESIYDAMSIEYGQKLNTFYQLRSLFAPLIEGLILLDRLTFLLEQVIFRVYIILEFHKRSVNMESKFSSQNVFQKTNQ